jgi:hypothetical protein
MNLRKDLWAKLAGDWKLDFCSIEIDCVGLSELQNKIEKILHGEITGRVVVEH